MKVERIIKDANDDYEYRIVLSIGNYRIFTSNLDISAQIRKKGARKWCAMIDTDDYKYRRLSMDDREEYVKNKYLTIPNFSQTISELKLELSELIINIDNYSYNV